jgi:hypothetical protein
MRVDGKDAGTWEANPGPYDERFCLKLSDEWTQKKKKS